MGRLILSAFVVFFVSIGLVWSCEDPLCASKIKKDEGPAECQYLKKSPDGLNLWRQCVDHFCKTHPKDSFCKKWISDKKTATYISTGESSALAGDLPDESGPVDSEWGKTKSKVNSNGEQARGKSESPAGTNAIGLE